MKKITVTLEVDIELDDVYGDVSREEAVDNVKGRITGFLYPVGQEVKTVRVCSIENNS